MAPMSLPTLWSWPPADPPIFWATVGATTVALWYVIVTARGVKNAWRANQAGLLKQILEEYADLAKAVEVVRQWWMTEPETAIQRYEQWLLAQDLLTSSYSGVTDIGESRRSVSQYFLRVRALCEKRMLDADLVAATLGDEPVQMFLLYIDPLDETVRRVERKK